jgi:hypothetical protein
MKSERNSIRLSASDLSNHLDCAHITTLEYSVATGRITPPDWTNPDTAVLQQLGFEHERKYLEHLGACGRTIADLRSIQLARQAAEETNEAMKRGADVIAQAALASGRWFGRADVLRRVETPSNLGAWSYEVYDCKLARETKAATILQLSLYSDLLAKVQGITPERMHVVSPSELFTPESFLVTEYAAYYRLVKSRLEQAVDSSPSDGATDAEPNPHCDVCRWWKRCDAEWRCDDHLSLVAGISRLQRKQLGNWDVETMAQLARFPLPLPQRPEYGSKEGYVRVREQARVQVAGRENLRTLSCVQKVTEESEVSCIGITEVTKPAEAIKALQDETANVVAGTVWLWAPETSAEVIDVLVVDEAGQMSLANVLAAAQSARSLVLLGDPQQLDQPLKGSHPDGAAVSALEHLLAGGAKTISSEQGLFLEHTWRLHPSICAFTSEAFYESRLQSQAGLEQQRLEGHTYLNGAGPWFVGIDHEGNQNASPEEAAVVEALVRGLLVPGVTWFNAKVPIPASVPLTPKDILVIAPYNVQVSDIANRLPRDVRVGTVDKFQGQEAAIVIYSLTTSSPEDAPRGMEFLYSLNRLNVATSRGRALCVVVGSPRLLEPQCRTPRQMQLANALCRFVELARRIRVTDARDGQYEFIALPAA